MVRLFAYSSSRLAVYPKKKADKHTAKADR